MVSTPTQAAATIRYLFTFDPPRWSPGLGGRGPLCTPNAAGARLSGGIGGDLLDVDAVGDGALQVVHLARRRERLARRLPVRALRRRGRNERLAGWGRRLAGWGDRLAGRGAGRADAVAARAAVEAEGVAVAVDAVALAGGIAVALVV